MTHCSNLPHTFPGRRHSHGHKGGSGGRRGRDSTQDGSVYTQAVSLVDRYSVCTGLPHRHSLQTTTERLRYHLGRPAPFVLDRDRHRGPGVRRADTGSKDRRSIEISFAGPVSLRRVGVVRGRGLRRTWGVSEEVRRVPDTTISEISPPGPRLPEILSVVTLQNKCL